MASKFAISATGDVTGKHRPPSIADLIIAATAELAGLTVLHVDKDFDLIAGISDQPLERLRVSRE